MPADALTNPDKYLEEIRANVQKMRAQGRVTPAENALFSMLDGMAGLMTFTLSRLADVTHRLEALAASRR